MCEWNGVLWRDWVRQRVLLSWHQGNRHALPNRFAHSTVRSLIHWKTRASSAVTHKVREDLARLLTAAHNPFAAAQRAPPHVG